jgi:hypothetical protein
VNRAVLDEGKVPEDRAKYFCALYEKHKAVVRNVLAMTSFSFAQVRHCSPSPSPSYALVVCHVWNGRIVIGGRFTMAVRLLFEE